MSGRSWPIREAQVALLSVSYGEKCRLELKSQGRLSTHNGSSIHQFERLRLVSLCRWFYNIHYQYAVETKTNSGEPA